MMKGIKSENMKKRIQQEGTSRQHNSKRQLLYELDRHPLEASPLTTLFHVLTKRNIPWWNEEEEDEQQGHQQGGGGGGTSAQGNKAQISNGGAGNSNNTAEQQQQQQNQQQNQASHQDGNKNSAAPDSRQRRPQTAASSREGKDIASLLIPQTIVWENNIPKGWFFYCHKEGQVLRKKVETKSIQQAFLKDAVYENDIVAVTYAQGVGDDKDQLQYQFLTAAMLPSFLFESRRGKGTCLLQHFVHSMSVTHNDMIQAVWTPNIVQVDKRQTLHPLFDERGTANQRCATFEGQLHHSQVTYCTSRLKQLVTAAANIVVSHFHETDPKNVITRLVLHFKMSDRSELMLLFCSSARVMPVNTDALLHSNLLGKYRVALNLSTKFCDLYAQDQQRAGSLGGYGSTTAPTANNASSGANNATNTSVSTQNKLDAVLEPPASALRPALKSDREPYVGSTRASRLGFVIRDARARKAMGQNKVRAVTSMGFSDHRGPPRPASSCSAYGATVTSVYSTNVSSPSVGRKAKGEHGSNDDLFSASLMQQHEQQQQRGGGGSRRGILDDYRVSDGLVNNMKDVVAVLEGKTAQQGNNTTQQQQHTPHQHRGGGGGSSSRTSSTAPTPTAAAAQQQQHHDHALKARKLVDRAIRDNGVEQTRAAYLLAHDSDALDDADRMELLYLQLLQHFRRKQQRKDRNRMSDGAVAESDEESVDEDELLRVQLEASYSPDKTAAALKKQAQKAAAADEIDHHQQQEQDQQQREEAQRQQQKERELIATAETRLNDVVYACQSHFGSRRDLPFDAALDAGVSYDRLFFRQLEAVRCDAERGSRVGIVFTDETVEVVQKVEKRKTPKLPEATTEESPEQKVEGEEEEEGHKSPTAGEKANDDVPAPQKEEKRTVHALRISYSNGVIPLLQRAVRNVLDSPELFD